MTTFIDHDKELIFIHIPKTAGISVTECLVGLENETVEYAAGGHATTIDVRRKIGDETYEKYFSFSVIREPYDWLVSLFEYRYQAISTILSTMGQNHYHPFECFIDNFHSSERLQGYWISRNDDIDVHTLVQFETLDSGINAIKKTFGISSPLKSLNIRNKNNIENHYANKQITEKATKLLETDLRLYAETSR
jgi:hypothetical protein|tara:strand:- start:6326 stop:6904 length:579 start_codon:yes stop_codon:yes gene_type:complete